MHSLLKIGLFTAVHFAHSCTPEQKPPVDIQVLDYVDPMIGTGFHGHTFPGAVVPHGRVQLSPDTHLLGWDASSGYHHDDTTLHGFSHTHLSGTGIGDLGDLLFLPFTGAFPDQKPIGTLSHRMEEATAGYYKLVVAPWEVKAELSAAKRTGWHRYTYPVAEEAALMVDLSHILQPDWGHHLVESQLTIIDEYTLQGYRLTSGWAATDPIWFTCVFDQPIIKHNLVVDGQFETSGSAQGKNLTAYLSFGKLTQPLNAKVGLSATDIKGSMINLAAATFGSFDSVVQAAQKTWKDELGAIVIETKDEQVLENFYSALYHSKIAPMVYSDADGRYRGLDGAIHKYESGERYTVYSIWDVFRSWYPLMTIIEPARARHWAYDIYEHSREGGLLPKWPLNGNYTGTMVGYPAVAILADAFEKGLLDSIPDKIIEASVASSMWQPQFYEKHQGTRAEKVMSKHIYFKEKLGFVPIDSCTESVSYGLEMAYYDWCIAVMADLQGEEELARKYHEKGKAYQHYFDADLKFMRGKNADGSWDDNFNPRFSDHQKSEFVEGNSWQWTPFVPHDIAGLAQLMGGKEALGIWLDKLFSEPSTIEGDNASGDITGLIGQFAHGNEPSHHVPFMYQFSDRPWRTQEVLDTIMNHFYQPTPAGIIGNEDCGQMSAWYVLNCLGLYQITPGKGIFTLGRPLIDKARIKVKDGWFTIEVFNNTASNKYIQKAALNDQSLDQLSIQYSDFKAGNILKIYMSNEHI